MILNPRAVLNELMKYQKIVGYAKMAFLRLTQGQPVDDIRDVLKVKLNECEFTQITSAGPAPTPLHSVTAYLDKADTLTQQIAEAEAFIQTVVEKIKSAVGPFYSRDEVKGFKEEGETTLGDQVWMPTMEAIKVKRYMDTKAGIVIQANWAHDQYRTAKDGEEFGQWKFFTK